MMTAQEMLRCIKKINPKAHVTVWQDGDTLIPKYDPAHIGKMPTLEECEAVLAEVKADIVNENRVGFLSNRQAKRQLVAMGLYDAIEAAVKARGQLAIIDWECASGFKRDDPTFLAIKKGLGLTDEQEDQFFDEGAKL